MLILKTALITSPLFQNAVRKLSDQPLSAKAAFDLKVLLNRMETAIKDSENEKFSLLNKYCQKDERGNFLAFKDEVKNEDGTIEFIERPGTVLPIEATKEEFEVKFTELIGRDHEIKGNKLTAESLGNAQLSAADVNLLSPILDFGQEEEIDNVLKLN